MEGWGGNFMISEKNVENKTKRKLQNNRRNIFLTFLFASSLFYLNRLNFPNYSLFLTALIWGFISKIVLRI
jgi:hypothetical protein